MAKASDYECPACGKQYKPLKGWQSCECGLSYIDFSEHLVRMGYLGSVEKLHNNKGENERTVT